MPSPKVDNKRQMRASPGWRAYHKSKWKGIAEPGFLYHSENGNPGISDQEVGKSVPRMQNAAVEGPCERPGVCLPGTQS